MIICVCHRVSDRDIAREVREGCCSFEALQDETRVATSCGACLDCAESIFQGCSARAMPSSAPVHMHPPRATA